MTLVEIFASLGVALGAGALIGVERQQAHGHEPDPGEFGGIRTFPLIALLGGVGAVAIPVAGLWLLGLLLVALGALLTVSYVHSTSTGDFGMSTEVAALLTFALGAVAAMPEVLPIATQRYLLVAAGAGVVMVLLALKRPLHGFSAKVSTDDIYATGKFVILALVVLPILPNRTFGPLDVLNPFKIGLMIVLVAGISFAGYVATRMIGNRRGILVAGLVGGLASSTAVTLTFSGRAKQEPRIAAACTVAIVAACSTMFARVLAVVGVVDPRLLSSLAWPLGAMAVVGFAAALLLLKREGAGSGASEEVPLKNPFELGQAVKFGLIYAVVLLVAKAGQTYLGTGGIYASAVLAGLTDVDAITLSLVDLHLGGLATTTAATGIALASITNTIVKGSLALSLGGPALGKRVALALGLSLTAGALTLAALWAMA